MVNQATATIKNVVNWSGDLGRITLFTGPNRSGKTAVSEAIRLALTNTCSVGASVDKQKLLIDGEAKATVSGGGVSAEWQIKGGKRSRKLVVDGMEVVSAQGDTPLTVEGYWDLTGEQRWAMVESIVGAFSEQPPDSLPAARNQLKALKSQVPPEKYEGQSTDELKRLAAHYESVIATAIESREAERARDSSLAQYRNELQHTSGLASKLGSEVTRFEQILSDGVQDRVAQIYIEWQQSPSVVLSGCGNLREAVNKLHAVISQKTFAIIGELGNLQPLTNLLSASHEVTQLEDLESYLIDSGEQFATRIVNVLARHGIDASEMDITNHQKILALVEPSKIREQLDRCKGLLENCNKRIADLEQLINSVSTQEIPTYGDAEAAAKSLDQIKRDLSKAIAYRDWLAGREAAAEQITKLEEDIAKADELMADYSRRRAEYLDKAAQIVSDKANELLEAMGFPKVGIQIDTTGKRNKLTAVSDGVDIQAMAGSEKLLYGVALLHAFQELGSARLPVLFVEAAELSDVNLEKFLSALAKHRTKGNVFVSHWYGMCVSGVVTHKFGG